MLGQQDGNETKSIFAPLFLFDNNVSNNRSLIGKHRHQTWNQWTLMPTITIYACVLLPFSYSEQDIEEGHALIYEWNTSGHLMLTDLKYIYCHYKELVTYTHRSESWWICKPIIQLAVIAKWEDGCCLCLNTTLDDVGQVTQIALKLNRLGIIKPMIRKASKRPSKS